MYKTPPGGNLKLQDAGRWPDGAQRVPTQAKYARDNATHTCTGETLRQSQTGD